MITNKYDCDEIQQQLVLLKKQDEKILEAERLKYNIAMHLEELYKGQVYAYIVYPCLKRLRDETDKKEIKAYLKELKNLLSDALPSDISFDKNPEVTTSVHSYHLESLDIEFKYKKRRYRLSIPNTNSISRVFFMDKYAWFEEAIPCIWEISDHSNSLIASAILPGDLKRKFLEKVEKDNG